MRTPQLSDEQREWNLERQLLALVCDRLWQLAHVTGGQSAMLANLLGDGKKAHLNPVPEPQQLPRPGIGRHTGRRVDASSHDSSPSNGGSAPRQSQRRGFSALARALGAPI